MFHGKMTNESSTFQMSDYLPLWLQTNTDIVGAQLQQIIQG